MIIKLNERYRITTDALNYTLEEKKVAKEGKNAGQEYWNSIGFYPKLEWAIAGVLKRHIQTTEIEGIQTIIDEIKKSTRSIQKQITILLGDTEV